MPDPITIPSYPNTATCQQIAAWNNMQPREMAPMLVQSVANGTARMVRRAKNGAEWPEFGKARP